MSTKRTAQAERMIEEVVKFAVLLERR